MNSTSPILKLDQPATYIIQLIGRLDEGWSKHFGGMTITHESIEDGTTITQMVGIVPDQAGLHGLLHSIRDLGLPLLKVEYLPGKEIESNQIFE
jgi:hypothetical protein